MATRTRSRRNINEKCSANDDNDGEQSPQKKIVKTGNARKNTNNTESPPKTSVPKRSPQKSKKKNESQKVNNPAPMITPKKGKKTKKDIHAFSSYFESKRATVQYNYHISPVAQVCLPSQSPGNQQTKPTTKKIQRKRKSGAIADVFDYCSDEEVVISSKKSKLASTNDTREKTAGKKDTKTIITKKIKSQALQVVVTKLPATKKVAMSPAKTVSKASGKARRPPSRMKPEKQVTKKDESLPVKRGRRGQQSAGGRTQVITK